MHNTSSEGQGKRLTVHLPWPPTVNHYWRYGQRRVHLAPAGYRYRTDTEAALLSQGIWRQQVRAPYCVKIAAFPPDHRRRDLDNTLKAVLDALQHSRILADDSLIDQLEIRRGEKIEGGQILVEISTLEACEPS